MGRKTEISVYRILNSGGINLFRRYFILERNYLMKTIYYVQVKRYRGETGSWAAEQISNLKELSLNKDDRQDDGYTKVYWVVSSSEAFTTECVNLAKDTNIQLVDGKSFVSMLLDAGFLGVCDVI